MKGDYLRYVAEVLIDDETEKKSKQLSKIVSTYFIDIYIQNILTMLVKHMEVQKKLRKLI